MLRGWRADIADCPSLREVRKLLIRFPEPRPDAPALRPTQRCVGCKNPALPDSAGRPASKAAARTVKSELGPPMTLGNAAAAAASRGINSRFDESYG